MREIGQAGVFRGEIIEYSLNEADSGAVAVNLNCKIHDIYSDGEWHDWRGHNLHARGDVWIVKKDGTLNQRQTTALMKHGGWDGQFSSVTDATWKPSTVGFTVETDEYKGEVRYRISFVNGYDSAPGVGNVSSDKAKDLDRRLGGQLRALAGNQQREAVAPTPGAPAKPAPAGASKGGSLNAKRAQPAPAPVETAPAETEDSIPF